MKLTILIGTLISVASAISVPAFADNSLQGADAAELASLLKSSGFAEITDVTVGFISVQDLSCIGKDFADRCQARQADSLPPAPLQAVDSNSASSIWALLKKAGIAQIDRNGNSSIETARIDCTVTSYDVSQDVCTIR